MTPNQFGRYEIRGEIGLGGMATVYHAWDPRFEREVAIKVLPPEYLHDPTFRGRFEREAKVIATLEHPGIVPVYDFGEQNGQPYLVMRYMIGKSLKNRLESGPLPIPEASRILERVAPALDYAHKRGVIHRDLKPDNILFDQQGEPYLSDFGIAKLAESGATLTGNAIVGTPAYMSPEQARGDKDLDGRSDIYALGAILFEMLTGQLPYSATTPMGQAIKHITDPVPNILERRQGLPPELQEIIALAMAKRKESRFATGAEVVAALVSVVRGEPLPRLMTRRTMQVSAAEIEAALKPAVETPEPHTPAPLPVKESEPEPEPLIPTPLKARQPEQRTPTPIPVKEVEPEPKPSTPAPVKDRKPEPKPSAPSPLRARQPEPAPAPKPQAQVRQPQAGASARPRVYLLLSIGLLVFLSAGAIYLFSRKPPQEDVPPTPVPTITVAEIIPSETPPSSQVNSAQGTMALLVNATGITYYKLPDGVPAEMKIGEDVPVTANTRLWTDGGAAKLEWNQANSLVLDENAILVVGESQWQVNAVLYLDKGTLLVESRYLAVRATGTDFEAVASNAQMGIFYEPAQGIFRVDCLSGSCKLGDLELSAGQRGEYNQGVLSDPMVAEEAPWQELASKAEGIASTATQEVAGVPSDTPELTATPTVTPTITRAASTVKPAATTKPTIKPTKKPTSRVPPTKTPPPP